MSSPIASLKKNPIKDILISFHQRLLHNHRVDVLSNKISIYIDSYFKDAEIIRCLDVGCGDMKISENIGKHNPRTAWSCIDIHDLPEHLKRSTQWSKYQKFDGIHIPFNNKSMDVVLFCDVLHHDQENALNLLFEAARVANIIIIKDHFEYSLYSRMMLKIMDFIGNWGYGVKVPSNYFTTQCFKELYQTAGLMAKKIDIGIDLYSYLLLPQWLLRPEWQFIALLEA